MKKAFALCLLLCFLFGQLSAFSEEENQGSIGTMEFVLIPAGSFMMGCNEKTEDCYDNETPAHEVIISKAFYMGQYEVTQKQWAVVMGENPSKFKSEDRPVETVSWNDVQEFIRRLNAHQGWEKYRLPTEAEWEYAARAGSKTPYPFGDETLQLIDFAWYDETSGGGSHPVGRLQPNAWGLYDIIGNVSEWVQDWRGYYRSGTETDPKGPSSGDFRVLRGGDWANGAQAARTAYRSYSKPGERYQNVGFRLVFSPKQEDASRP